MKGKNHYASLRIRGSILDQIRKMDWIPRTLRQKQKMLDKALQELETELGRFPTEEEIAEKLDIKVDDVNKLEKNKNEQVAVNDDVVDDAKPYDAQTLLDIGWAMRVYIEGTKEQALADFIEHMAKIHPSVHQAYKEIELRKWRERNMYNRVMEEIRMCAKLWESKAHHEAVQNFLSKSKK